MSDNNPSTQTAESLDAPALSNAEVAKKLESFFDFSDETPVDEEQNSDDVAEEAADEEGTPPETEASADDDEDAQPDTDESGPVEAPRSMSAEDREKFNKLPPEMRSFIASRENERDAITNRRLEEVAAERKQFAQVQQQHQQTQMQYQQNIDTLIDLAIPEIKELEKVDWVKLSQENQPEYIRLKAMKENLEHRVQYMGQQSQLAKSQAQDAYKSQHDAFVYQQTEQLRQEIPDFQDPAKSRTLLEKMARTAGEYGVTAEQFCKIVDPRQFKMLLDLANLKEKETAKKAVAAKKGNVAPKFQKPNAVMNREGIGEAQAKRDMAILRKTGTPRDAARVFERFV